MISSIMSTSENSIAHKDEHQEAIDRENAKTLKLYRDARGSKYLAIPAWSRSGLASITNFLNDSTHHVCFVQSMDMHPSAWELTQLAACMMGGQEAQKYPISLVRVAQDYRSSAVQYDDHWIGLARSVALNLNPITKDGIKVRAPTNPDYCLLAIEAVKELTRTFEPTLYIGGIDRAYDMNYALQIMYNTDQQVLFEMEEAEIERRQKVLRMVRALFRLFQNRGKLVFLIGPTFDYTDLVGQTYDYIPVFAL
ncbi:hypothetical protein F5Y09DRAFT_315251 [Xylaria sp. FL1042]|nr:hypothetical protein F5Y09DRAFT_315251 [Xylaria sp. FL1042]